MISNNKTVLSLFILATCLICQGLTNRDLQASSSSSSSATARGNGDGGAAVATSSATSYGGHSSATSVADSATFKKATSEIRTLCVRIISKIDPPKKWYNHHNYCLNMLQVIQEDLKAIGSVCVKAYASAFGEVKVTGHGNACASASATAQTSAASFATIMVDALIGLDNGYTKKHVSNKVKVVSGAFAEVFAAAAADACVSHGYAMAVQESFAEAIVQPVARLFMILAAKVDCHDVRGYSYVHNEGASTIGVDHVKTDSKGHAVVDGKGDASANGHVKADTGKLSVCGGFTDMCCGHTYRNSKKCTCTFSSYSSFKLCNMKKVSGTGDVMIWENVKDGQKCMC